MGRGRGGKGVKWEVKGGGARDRDVDSWSERGLGFFLLFFLSVSLVR